MLYLGIDPGTKHTGYAVYDDVKKTIFCSGKPLNDKMIQIINKAKKKCVILIEMLDGGRKVGETTLETAVWIGRFIEHCDGNFTRINRSVVLEHFGARKKATKLAAQQLTADPVVKWLLERHMGENFPTFKSGDEYQALALIFTHLKIEVKLPEEKKQRAKRSKSK